MKLQEYGIHKGSILESKFRPNWFLIVNEISEDGRFAFCQRIIDGHLCPNHTTLYVSNFRGSWKIVKNGVQLVFSFQRSR